MKSMLAALCVIGFGLAGCGQTGMDTDATLATSATTSVAATPSDGTTLLATIAAHPERYLDQTVVVRGRLIGWKTGPALTQDGTNVVLPLLGNAQHIGTLFPQVDDSQRVEISGIVATNNTTLLAAVGIVPKRLANI